MLVFRAGALDDRGQIWSPVTRLDPDEAAEEARFLAARWGRPLVRTEYREFRPREWLEERFGFRTAEEFRRYAEEGPRCSEIQYLSPNEQEALRQWLYEGGLDADLA